MLETGDICLEIPSPDAQLRSPAHGFERSPVGEHAPQRRRQCRSIARRHHLAAIGPDQICGDAALIGNHHGGGSGESGAVPQFTTAPKPATSSLSGSVALDTLVNGEAAT